MMFVDRDVVVKLLEDEIKLLVGGDERIFNTITNGSIVLDTLNDCADGIRRVIGKILLLDGVDDSGGRVASAVDRQRSKDMLVGMGFDDSVVDVTPAEGNAIKGVDPVKVDPVLVPAKVVSAVDRDAVLKLISGRAMRILADSADSESDFVGSAKAAFILGGVSVGVEGLPSIDIAELPSGSLVLSAREVEVVECFAKGWSDSDNKSLYGNLSYNDAFDFMGRLGVDSSAVRAMISDIQSLCDARRLGGAKSSNFLDRDAVLKGDIE